LCSGTLLITGEKEEDWNNLFASWLSQYQNPDENTVLYTFVVKTAQAEWFRLRAQNEFDFFLENYSQPAIYCWDAERLKRHELLMRYVTAAERKFQRDYRMLEHHWKSHHAKAATKPVTVKETKPEPEPQYHDKPLIQFINHETGEWQDAHGNKYPAPPDYKPEPIIPGVYPPGHLYHREPKGDRKRR
jgi:hypothetical protein